MAGVKKGRARERKRGKEMGEIGSPFPSLHQSLLPFFFPPPPFSMIATQAVRLLALFLCKVVVMEVHVTPKSQRPAYRIKLRAKVLSKRPIPLPHPPPPPYTFCRSKRLMTLIPAQTNILDQGAICYFENLHGTLIEYFCHENNWSLSFGWKATTDEQVGNVFARFF